MSENEIEMNVEEIVEFHVAKPRGRKPKYLTEEERKIAKREQNKRYRTKKHEELVALRRAFSKMNEISEQNSSEQES